MRKESDDNGLIGSLFSGYGGLDLGVGMALGGGMPTAYTSDIEPGPCAIERYHAHGDDCPNLGDITKIDFERLPDTDVVVGGSPCFPAGSLVLTDRGFIPIEQVRVGDLALTHLGNWKRVIDTGCHIGDTIVLKGQGTPGIECTPNHPFLAGHRCRGPWDNGRRAYPTMFVEDGWIPAADMMGRMWLNMGGNVPALPIPGFDFTGCQTRDIRLSAPFFYFVGRWLGDGWLDIVKRTGREVSYMKRVFVCDSFDKEDELRDRLDATALHDWLEKNFGEGAENKTIPAWAFGMKREWREALLAGYTDSDGCPLPNGAGWRAATVSRRLSIGVEMLAAGLGYPGSASSIVNRRPSAVIEGRIVDENPQYPVSWYTHARKSVLCNSGFWGHVRKIEAGRSNVRVYNLSVEDDESYTVDGIAVHNCTDVSSAGKRAGMVSGTRSGLWSYQAELVGQTRPALVCWENVAGCLSGRAASKADVEVMDERAKALRDHGLCGCDEPDFIDPEGFSKPSPDAIVPERSDDALLAWAKARHVDVSGTVCARCGLPVFERSDGGLLSGNGRLDGVHTAPTIRALGRVLGDLANLGYDAVWRGLEAADVGAPHHRLRIFVTAWPRDPNTARTPVNARLKRLTGLPPMNPRGRAWAVWDGDGDVWTTGEADLFGHVDVYMDAWPKSGVMAAGRAYMVPGSWLKVPEPAAGSVLATPKASDGVFAAPATSGRPLDRSTFLSTQVRLMDLPGRMDPEKVREHDSRLPTRIGQASFALRPSDAYPWS